MREIVAVTILLSLLVQPAVAQPFQRFQRKARPAVLPEALAHKLFQDADVQQKKELKPKMKESGFQYSTFFFAELLDLNDDGKPEYVIHQNPDMVKWLPKHNQPTYIYESVKGDQYRPLISCYGAVSLAKTKTEGYRDLIVSQYTNPTRSEEVLCKYHAPRYKVHSCYTRINAEYKQHSCECNAL